MDRYTDHKNSSLTWAKRASKKRYSHPYGNPYYTGFSYLVKMDRAQNVVTRARHDNVVEGSKFSTRLLVGATLTSSPRYRKRWRRSIESHVSQDKLVQGQGQGLDFTKNDFLQSDRFLASGIHHRKEKPPSKSQRLICLFKSCFQSQ